MKSSFKYHIALVLIFILFMGSLLFWQSHNVNYFNYDSLRHFLRSRYIFDKHAATQTFSFHPPFVHIATSLFYSFILPTQKNAVRINTSIFLAILLFSLYNIGKLVKNERLGILSCVIILFYPVVFNQAKIYMLDLPLLSVVTLNIYFLIKSDYFKNKKYTALFVISCFVGILTKLFFPVYVLGPFFYVVCKSFKSKEVRSSSVVVLSVSLFALFALYAVLSFPHLKLIHKIMVLGEFFKGLPAWGIIKGLKDIPFFASKIRSFLWYVWGFINWQAGFLFFILFLWGLFVFLKNNSPYKRIIIIWLFSSYAILAWFISGINTDMEVTAIRYSMPILASIAIISSYGLLNFNKRLFKKSIIGLVILYGVLNTAVLSFPLLKTSFALKLNLRQDKYHILPSYLNIYSAKPLIISGSNWLSHPQDKGLIYKEIKDVFFFINKFYNDKTIKVLLVSDTPDWWHLKYLSYKHNRDIMFICDYNPIRISLKQLPKKYRKAQREKMLYEDLDFVIVPKKPFTEPGLIGFAERLKKRFERNRDNFYLIKEDAFCKIFKNKSL